LTVRRELLELVAGFAIWAVGFIVLYALQALGCVYGWPWHRVLLVFAYAICLVPLAVLALRKRQASTSATPLGVAALWTSRAALASGVIVFVPVTFATLCH
jgi:hypothetical protein